jgi:uncharacterized protein (DUF433 family)
MTIDELLANLQVELKDIEHSVACYERQAETERQAAALLSARIQGIQQARAMISQQPENDAEPTERKPRRDIRAMVREDLVQRPDEPYDDRVRDLAKRFECRPSQIKDALRAEAA